MISVERVYNKLEKQAEYLSVVELAMMLEASTSEVRQRLNELGTALLVMNMMSGESRGIWLVHLLSRLYLLRKLS